MDKMKRRLLRTVTVIILTFFTGQNVIFAISPPIVHGNLGDPKIRDTVKREMYATARRQWKYREEDHKLVKKGISTISRGVSFLEKRYMGSNMSEKIKSVTAQGLRVYRMADGKIRGAIPQIRDVIFRDKGAHGIPKEWKKNPIFESKNIIEALKYYQKNEAKIPDNLLEIEEGYFEVDEKGGELPIGRIYKKPLTPQEIKKLPLSMRKKVKYKYVLIVHTKFAQMWDHIRQKDILFDHNFSEDFEQRTVSLAWGIFYRFAKHEMGDLFEEKEIYEQPLQKNLLGRLAENIPFLNLSRFFSKGGGHLTMHSSLGYLQKPNEDELYTNVIGGRYNLVNDALWLWFLQSYSFFDTTRYDNNELRDRLDWVFNSKKATDLGLRNEFPNLWMSINENRFNEGRKRENRIQRAIDIAAFVNYHFFIKPSRFVVVPKVKDNKDKFLQEYNYLKKVSIGEPMDATGKQGFLTGKKSGFTGHNTESLSEEPDEPTIFQEEDIKAANKLSLEKMQNIFDSINLLGKSKVEILLPQTMYEHLKKELKEKVKVLEKNRNVKIRAYDIFNIEQMLKKKDVDVKRIIISDDESDELLWNMAKIRPEIFRNERLFSVGWPDNYETLSEKERKTFYENIMVLAILSVMVHKDDNVFVKDLLIEILTEQFKYSAENTQKFIDKIAVLEDGATSEEIYKRVLYFLEELPPIKMVNSLVGKNELVEEFLIYA